MNSDVTVELLSWLFFSFFYKKKNKTESIIQSVICVIARDFQQPPLSEILEERGALLYGNACEPSSVKLPSFMWLKED